MDVISLLITIAGIIIILALYLLSQVSRNKIPKAKNVASIPNIVDDNGDKFTSILDDIPATDGSTPKPIPVSAPVTDSATVPSSQNTKEKTSQPNPAKKQNILFISAKDEKGLDGNIIDKVFTESGLSYGDMDIYHYILIGNNGDEIELFRVANGVDPWTLRPQDLQGKQLPGLSLLLVTPTPIDDKKAMKTFIDTAKTISAKLNGELKNQQQQAFTKKDEKNFLASS